MSHPSPPNIEMTRETSCTFEKTLLVFLCIACAAFAQNNSDRLKGDFPFNETLQFITGSPQNGTCPHVLTGTVTQSVVTNTGVRSFDGARQRQHRRPGMLMQVPSTDASQVAPSNGVCKGRYQLLDGDTVDLHYDCSTSPGSFFKVHTMGKITPNNILVGVHHRIDGSLEVTPFFVGGNIEACVYIAEDCQNREKR